MIQKAVGSFLVAIRDIFWYKNLQIRKKIESSQLLNLVLSIFQSPNRMSVPISPPIVHYNEHKFACPKHLLFVGLHSSDYKVAVFNLKAQGLNTAWHTKIFWDAA